MWCVKRNCRSCLSAESVSLPLLTVHSLRTHKLLLTCVKARRRQHAKQRRQRRYDDLPLRVNLPNCGLRLQRRSCASGRADRTPIALGNPGHTRRNTPIQHKRAELEPSGACPRGRGCREDSASKRGTAVREKAVKHMWVCTKVCTKLPAMASSCIVSFIQSRVFANCYYMKLGKQPIIIQWTHWNLVVLDLSFTA